jgi:hypothetical protein
VKDFLNSGSNVSLDESQLGQRLQKVKKLSLIYFINKKFIAWVTLTEDKENVTTKDFNGFC